MPFFSLTSPSSGNATQLQSRSVSATAPATGSILTWNGPAWERHYAEVRGLRCLQCSYNTRDGVNVRGGRALRGNYPGIGFTYDEQLDAFLPPRPEGDGWGLTERRFSGFGLRTDVCRSGSSS